MMPKTRSTKEASVAVPQWWVATHLRLSESDYSVEQADKYFEMLRTVHRSFMNVDYITLGRDKSCFFALFFVDKKPSDKIINKIKKEWRL